MASLVSLPTEMQDIIIDHLTSPDLISLALTCRHFHALAIPKAYQHLSLTWTNTSESVKRNPRLDYLHRTLDRNPELERIVKHLTLATSGCVSFTDDGQIRASIPMGNEEKRDLFLDMMSIVGRCALERLELAVELFLGHESTFRKRWITLLFEKALQGQQRSDWMRTLRHVRTTCEFTKHDWEPDRSTSHFHSLMWFMLPNIETLDLAYFDPNIAVNEDGDELEEDEIIETFWNFHPIPPAHPVHLHTLRIGFSSTTALLLDLVLKQLPNLRVFDIDLFQHPSKGSFDLDRLKMGLNHVNSTLTHLRLRYDVIFDEAFCEDTCDLVTTVAGRIGSLQDFAALTHLEISLHILFGSEDSFMSIFYPLSAVLPPNLEVLIVTDDLYMFNDFQQYFEDKDVMEIFRKFLEDGKWKTATPNLKSFTYDLRGRGEYTIRYWDQRKTRNELRRMIKAQGLEGTLLWE